MQMLKYRSLGCSRKAFHAYLPNNIYFSAISPIKAISKEICAVSFKIYSKQVFFVLYIHIQRKALVLGHKLQLAVTATIRLFSYVILKTPLTQILQLHFCQIVTDQFIFYWQTEMIKNFERHKTLQKPFLAIRFIHIVEE